MRARELALLPSLLLAGLLSAGCGSQKSYHVNSNPPGAEVSLDGQPVGRTPTTVLLDTGKAEHQIVLSKAGYLPYEQRVSTKPVLEGPTQRCAAVACSPCCLFLPLALCWEQTFVPKAVSADLVRAGQGIEVICRPIGAEIWVDGKLAGQAEPYQEETEEGGTRVQAPSDCGVAVVMLEPKVVKVEVRADGYHPRVYEVQVPVGVYIHLKFELVRKD